MNVVGPGEGETIRPGFEIKVALPELVLTEAVYAAGARGPDPHVHHDHADSFFVLEGQLEWRVGPELEAHAGTAGSFVSVPPDVLHTFHNPGPGETRFLNLHAPGLGFERYLRGDFPEFDQHYLPEGSGLEPTDVIVLGSRRGRAAAARRVRRRRSRSAATSSPSSSSSWAATSRTRLRTATCETLEAFYVLDGELGLHGRRRGVAGRRPTAAPRSRPGRSTPPRPASRSAT